MVRPIVLAATMLLAGPASAQKGVERWSATSTTAMSITGDIVLSPTRLTAAGRTLPLKVAADVRGFGTDHGPVGARILKVTRPANPVLKNGNRLCTAPVRWVAVWREQTGDLGMAVFAGTRQPAREDVPGLCGTFLYSRP